MNISQKNLTIVIIDDEEKQRQALKLYINRILPENNFDFHLCESVKQGVETIEEKLPDLVFLDIEMPEANGFELFKRIKKDFFEVVFVTAYAEYMEKSINEIGCFGYLLKPLEKEKLRMIFERFFKQMPNTKYLKFISSLNGKKIMVELENIAYITADTKYCYLNMKDGKTKHFWSKSMLEAENGELPEQYFVRISRSGMVNINYVKVYDSKKNEMLLKHPKGRWEKVLHVTGKYKKNIDKRFL